MSLTHPELALLAWAVRILGTLGVLCLLLCGAYLLLQGAMRLWGQWSTLTALSYLWYCTARRDRAKLWTAAQHWAAWNVGGERQREVKAAEERLHRRYENREAYLRAHYDIPADELVDRDSDGHLLSVMWSAGSEDAFSAKVKGGTEADENRGTDSRDDLV